MARRREKDEYSNVMQDMRRACGCKQCIGDDGHERTCLAAAGVVAEAVDNLCGSLRLDIEALERAVEHVGS